MANCHKNFITASNAFHSKISLDDEKKKALKTSRINLRRHIKSNFEEKNRPIIKFQIQGSFSMDTTVNPLDGDFDIDDGLYFSPELINRPNPETVHSWVVEAAKSYRTIDPPVDKQRCVRIPFKAGYHIDIPIYDLKADTQDNKKPELAEKGIGWKHSDPLKITQWFRSKVSDTSPLLRRLVRYFKAWADYQSQGYGTKMPSGLVLTILVAEEYQYDEYDDVAFAKTASAIYNRLKINQSIPNPSDRSYEDLRDRISGPHFDYFMNRLDALIQHAETALELENAKEAAKNHWCHVLGDRFPVIDDDNGKGKSESKVQVSMGLIGVGTSGA